MTFRIATRRSELATTQAGIVRLMLKELGHDAVLLPIDTSGDLDARGDGKERWVDAIVESLRTGRADLAVHSAKDLPADDPEDLVLAAVPERADPRDVLVAADDAFLDGALPRPGARVGTSSLRRAAQLRAAVPGVEIVDLRGNLPTRLRKVLAEGVADVAVLAAAGLDRLGLTPPTVVPLETDVMVPAPGQGALAIQCRTDDRPLRALLSSLDHRASATAVAAERALTRALGGDCNVPLGAIAVSDGDRLHLEACVASPDGETVLRASGDAADPEEAARQAADQLRRDGADAIVEAVKAR